MGLFTLLAWETPKSFLGNRHNLDDSINLRIDTNKYDQECWVRDENGEAMDTVVQKKRVPVQEQCDLDWEIIEHILLYWLAPIYVRVNAACLYLNQFLAVLELGSEKPRLICKHFDHGPLADGLPNVVEVPYNTFRAVNKNRQWRLSGMREITEDCLGKLKNDAPGATGLKFLSRNIKKVKHGIDPGDDEPDLKRLKGSHGEITKDLENAYVDPGRTFDDVMEELFGPNARDCGVTSGWPVVQIELLDYWWNWKFRGTFTRIVFNPNPPGTRWAPGRRDFNKYIGLATSARECRYMLEFNTEYQNVKGLMNDHMLQGLHFFDSRYDDTGKYRAGFEMFATGHTRQAYKTAKRVEEWHKCSLTGEPDKFLLDNLMGAGCKWPVGEIMAAFIDYHVRYVLCNGEEDEYDAFIDQLATIFQRPWDTVNYCTIFVGQKGIGKGVFINSLGAVLGKRYFMVVSDLKRLTGQFNAALKDKLLVFCDEVDATGVNMGILQALITEPSGMSEAKFREQEEIPRFTNYIMATDRFGTNIPNDSRRFNVIQASPELRPKEYYDTLAAFLKDNNYMGTRAWLGATVYRRDLHGITKATRPPKSRLMRINQLRYLDTVGQSLWQWLRRGYTNILEGVEHTIKDEWKDKLRKEFLRVNRYDLIEEEEDGNWKQFMKLQQLYAAYKSPRNKSLTESAMMDGLRVIIPEIVQLDIVDTWPIEKGSSVIAQLQADKTYYGPLPWVCIPNYETCLVYFCRFMQWSLEDFQDMLNV